MLHVNLGPWSGLDVLKELRRRSQMPILMLTGCASESVEALSFEFGADDYLEKPINPGDLIARIRGILAHYRRAQEQAEIHVQLNSALRGLVEARDCALAEARQAARATDEGLALAAHHVLESLTIVKSVARLHRGWSCRTSTRGPDELVHALAQIEENASKITQELLAGRRLQIGQVLELHRTPGAARVPRTRALGYATREARPPNRSTARGEPAPALLPVEPAGCTRLRSLIRANAP